MLVQEMWVPSLVQEDPLEKEMATHSSILAWEIPGQRSLGGYSPRSRKESDMTKHTQHSASDGQLCDLEVGPRRSGGLPHLPGRLAYRYFCII